MIRFELSPGHCRAPDQRVRLAHPSISKSVVNQLFFRQAPHLAAASYFTTFGRRRQARFRNSLFAPFSDRTRGERLHLVAASRLAPAASAANSCIVTASGDRFKGVGELPFAVTAYRARTGSRAYRERESAPPGHGSPTSRSARSAHAPRSSTARRARSYHGTPARFRRLPGLANHVRFGEKSRGRWWAAPASAPTRTRT